mgnify:CR=1 FL=1
MLGVVSITLLVGCSISPDTKQSSQSIGVTEIESIPFSQVIISSSNENNLGLDFSLRFPKSWQQREFSKAIITMTGQYNAAALTTGNARQSQIFTRKAMVVLYGSRLKSIEKFKEKSIKEVSRMCQTETMWRSVFRRSGSHIPKLELISFDGHSGAYAYTEKPNVNGDKNTYSQKTILGLCVDDNLILLSCGALLSEIDRNQNRRSLIAFCRKVTDTLKINREMN